MSDKVRFTHRLRLNDFAKQIPLVIGTGVLLIVVVLIDTGELWRGLVVAAIVAAFLNLLFALGSLGYWVELSESGVRTNKITGVTPGGPIGSRSRIPYEQMQSLTLSAKRDSYGRQWFRLTYQPPKGLVKQTDFGIDAPECAEFVDELVARLSAAGITINIAKVDAL
jgi:hypothetical protein